MSARHVVGLTLVLSVFGACGPEDTSYNAPDMTDSSNDISEDVFIDLAAYAALPYAQEVVSFEPGDSAGYGQERMPSVVLGPPRSRGVRSGSLDVVSLGVGGEIVLGFDAWRITDGPGADFVVFENAFLFNKDSVFSELGEVSVSEDGQTWFTFTCAVEPVEPGLWPGCAGWSPTRAYDPLMIDPLDPELSGGDAFDLADVGIEQARYVRIRDLSVAGGSPSAGFDLDAVGLVHATRVER